MGHSLRYLFHLAFRCGSLGLFTVGILDSSVLILPFGNDFLLLGLSASHISHVPLYVVAATLGSVCGVAVTLWLSRKAGEKVSKQHKGGAWKYVQKHTQRRGGLALTFASVMPPPFPFTMFVAAAGALKVPWKKVLLFVAGGRALRFTIEGVLAIRYGRWILSIAESPALKISMYVMVAITLGGIAYSIYNLFRRRG